MSLLRPPLCRAMVRPVRWIPRLAHSSGMALLLNQVLGRYRSGEDMRFLRGKNVQLMIDDIGLTYSLHFSAQGRFHAGQQDGQADVRISGDLQAFLLLATQREDADSLFFRRLLRMQGDTATGLHLKNFLDALGEPPLPVMVRKGLQRFTDLYLQGCVENPVNLAGAGVQRQGNP